MVFFELLDERRWSNDALKIRIKTTTMNCGQHSPPPLPLTNEISNILFAFHVNFDANTPATCHGCTDKCHSSEWLGKKNEIKVRRPQRTFEVTFHPFEPLCQLKRLCEGNLWPPENDWYGNMVVRFFKTLLHVPPSSLCFVCIRGSHHFHVFLPIFSESFLACSIWCLWPFERNTQRNELNVQLNARKIERTVFSMTENGFKGFVWALRISRCKSLLSHKLQCSTIQANG